MAQGSNLYKNILLVYIVQSDHWTNYKVVFRSIAFIQNSIKLEDMVVNVKLAKSEFHKLACESVEY